MVRTAVDREPRLPRNRLAEHGAGPRQHRKPESTHARREPFFLLFLVLVAGALATWAIFRYLTILLHAVRVGERSTCQQCAAYGLLEMTGARAVRGDNGRQGKRTAVAVRCRKCGHEWTIEQQ